MTQDADSDEDARLVLAARSGNRNAFADLLSCHYPSVCRLCRRLLGSPWEAEDVAQEAALQAMLGLERLDEPAHFGAWFHAIAVNLARKTLRRRQTTWDELPEAVSFTVMWTEPAVSPEEALFEREVHDRILAALNELSEVNREAVIGFYLAGYNQRELARLLHVPVSTIRGRLYQGRHKLEESLSPHAEQLSGQVRRKESIMEQAEWIQVERSRFLFPFAPDGFASHTVIELREVNGSRAFPLRISPAEGEVLWNSPLGKESQERGPRDTIPVVQGWTLKMMKTLGIRVQRVSIQRLIDTAYYASITVAQGKRVKEIEARPGEALLLAASTGAPVYVARSVLESVGYDWEELLAFLNTPHEEREHNLPAHVDLRRRVLERVAEEKDETQAALLIPEMQQRLAALLGRLLLKSGGTLAFIVDHRAGNLVAWAGSARDEDLKLLSRVLGIRPRSLRDLSDLLLYVHSLIGEIAQGDAMPFAQVGLGWQLNLVVPRARADAANPVHQPYYERALAELSRIVEELGPAADQRR